MSDKIRSCKKLKHSFGADLDQWLPFLLSLLKIVTGSNRFGEWATKLKKSGENFIMERAEKNQKQAKSKINK